MSKTLILNVRIAKRELIRSTELKMIKKAFFTGSWVTFMSVPIVKKLSAFQITQVKGEV